MAKNLGQLNSEIRSFFETGREEFESGKDFPIQTVLNKCIQALDEHSKLGGIIDPRPQMHLDENVSEEFKRRKWNGFADEFNIVYNETRKLFFEFRLREDDKYPLVLNAPFAAIELLLHGWQALNRIQEECRYKVYKGGLAIWLVILYQCSVAKIV